MFWPVDDYDKGGGSIAPSADAGRDVTIEAAEAAEAGAAETGESGTSPCGANLKLCSGQCQAADDPAYGCSNASCAPVSTDSDPEHCGVCEFSCLGGQCASGHCVPEDLVTQSPNLRPSQLAIVGSELFFTSQGNWNPPPYDTSGTSGIANGTLSVMPVGGGTPTALVSGLKNPDPIAAYGGNVYFAENAENGKLWRVSTTDHSAAQLVTGQAIPDGIAVDSGGLYWVTFGDGSLWKAAHDGSNATAIKQGGAQKLMGIALCGDRIYVTEYVTGGRVLRIAREGGVDFEEVYADADAQPAGIACTSKYVFWVGREGAVWRKELSGTGAAVKLKDGLGKATFVTVDAVSAYWTQQSLTAPFHGMVQKIPQAGGSELVLATELQTTRGVAVDDEYVYWADERTGKVTRAPKGP